MLRFKIEYDFKEKGAYVGIVSAGHPSTDMIYTAVFPFEVGASGYGYGLPLSLLLAGRGFLCCAPALSKETAGRRPPHGQGVAQ